MQVFNFIALEFSPLSDCIDWKKGERKEILEVLLEVFFSIEFSLYFLICLEEK